jgi:hypothetical protein
MDAAAVHLVDRMMEPLVALTPTRSSWQARCEICHLATPDVHVDDAFEHLQNH